MPAISCCRSCTAQGLLPVLDLGETPLANALLKQEDLTKPEARYPLALVWCRHCTLLQITEHVPAETLFGHYLYRSSFSDAFLDHCRTLAARLIAERALDKHNLVIDIASNDGYLLTFYAEKGIPILGIEPAANIASIAAANGIPTRAEFFTNVLAQRLRAEGTQADVIHAHNVMPHVADQRDFAMGIASLLKPDGIAVIEFAYAIDTIDHTEFDQIYHEHMCYFSLTAFRHLCEQFGLAVQSVERLAMHGGSLRVMLGHAEHTVPDATVTALLNAECAWGVENIAPYAAFAARTAHLKTDVMALLRRLKDEGKRIAIYGASAKGSTLMNFFGITGDLVDYIVDRSTLKQGLFAPGTHLPIRPVETLLEDRPDYVLLLTWNFVTEILQQQQAYRDGGGRFIVPIPALQVL